MGSQIDNECDPEIEHEVEDEANVDYNDTDIMKSSSPAKDLDGANHLTGDIPAVDTNTQSADIDSDVFEAPAAADVRKANVSFDSRDLVDKPSPPQTRRGLVLDITEPNSNPDTPDSPSELQNNNVSPPRTQWIRKIPSPEPGKADSEEDLLPVAPDGGWGWVVVAAAFCLYIILGSIWFSFSVLYQVYADHFQASLATIGMIASVEALVLHMTGAACSGVIEMFGCRTVAITGSFISAGSTLAASFVNSVPMLYVTYGFTGFGCGLTFLPAAVTVQQYFDKKRAFATGISLTGFSVSTFLMPPLSQWMVETLGWRGTLMMISGIYLNGIPLGALLRPLPKPVNRRRIRRLSRASSISESTNFFCRKCSKVFKQLCSSIFNFSLFRNPRFTLYGIATFFFNMAYIAFFMHYVNRAKYMGIEEHKAMLLPSIYGVCNGAFRVLSGAIANIPTVNRTVMYGCFIMLGGITAFLSCLAHNFAGLAMASAVFGISVGGVISIQHTVLVDLLGIDNIARSAGLLQIFLGLSGAITTPFAGWLFDLTGDYRIPYYVTGGIEILGALIIFFIAFMTHKQDKRRPIDINGRLPRSKLSSHELEKMMAGEVEVPEGRGMVRQDSFVRTGAGRYTRQDSRSSHYRPRASSTSSTLSIA